MEIALLWVGFSLVVGVLAGRYGRSSGGWALLALLISPLLAGALLLAAGRRETLDPEAPRPETHVRCPDCRELVRADAVKCRHCGAALVPQRAVPTADELAVRDTERAATRALGWVMAVVVGLLALLVMAYGQ